MDDREERNRADWFRVMALMCVRNTQLEAIHSGIVPVSRTGDFSDVTVVDANGRRIPWPKASHFDDEAMRGLMRQVVNRLYTFHIKAGEPDFQRIVEPWLTVARGWDAPEVDDALFAAIESRRGHDARVSGPVAGKAGRACS